MKSKVSKAGKTEKSRKIVDEWMVNGTGKGLFVVYPTVNQRYALEFELKDYGNFSIRTYSTRKDAERGAERFLKRLQEAVK